MVCSVLFDQSPISNKINKEKRLHKFHPSNKLQILVLILFHTFLFLLILPQKPKVTQTSNI